MNTIESDRLQQLLQDTVEPYPWNLWHRDAMANPYIPKSLAELGRVAICASYLESWTGTNAESICQAHLTTLAVRAPKTTERMLELFLQTNGLTEFADEQTGQAIPNFRLRRKHIHYLLAD